VKQKGSGGLFGSPVDMNSLHSWEEIVYGTSRSIYSKIWSSGLDILQTDLRFWSRSFSFFRFGFSCAWNKAPTRCPPNSVLTTRRLLLQVGGSDDQTSVVWSICKIGVYNNGTELTCRAPATERPGVRTPLGCTIAAGRWHLIGP